MPSDGNEHLPFIVSFFAQLNTIVYLYIQCSVNDPLTTPPHLNVDLRVCTDGQYSLNNSKPIETRENTEQVCAFLLYADSATKQNG
jgi:hypothetical protein